MRINIKTAVSTLVVLGLYWLCADTLIAQEGLSRADQYRAVLLDPMNLEPAPEAAIGDSLDQELTSRVKTSLEAFTLGIIEAVGDKPFTAHQFLGYSGAGFADYDRFEDEFRRSVLLRVEITKDQLGPEAQTVLILGGSVDGFGKGYEIIQEMHEQNEIEDVVVVGMVSNKVVDYHIEGAEKGWGHVISPHQSIVYLKETFTNSNGDRSWELKSSEIGESDTPKVLKDLSRFSNSGVMTFNVYGGGVQAFNETLELILEARARPQDVDINLHIDFLPGKAAKDTGYRASDMLAFILAKYPYLLSENLKVRVFSEETQMTLEGYTSSDSFKKYQDAFESVGNEIAKLKDMEETPEVQAEIRFYEALQQIDEIAVLEIEKFRVRSAENLERVRSIINSSDSLLENPDQYRSALETVDGCVSCQADAEKLRMGIETKLGCGELFAPKGNK